MTIFLAPMEGVIDFLLRDILTSHGGIDYCVTEFMRVTDKLIPAHVYYRDCPELLTGGKTRAGTPVFVQLLGGQAQPLAENAALAVELGAPGIDLNFGCPAKTVNRHDGGATLLKNPERIANIVSSVRSAVDSSLPVSAKIRLGCDDKSLFLENAIAAEEGGAKWLTVHARTKLEGYKPPAHWSFITEIREKLTIPVIANGDIFSPSDLKACQAETGCEHFMIGRGVVARPDLCAVIAGEKEMQWPDILRLLQSFLIRAEENSKSSYAISRFKQWSRQITRHYKQEEFFTQIKRLNSSAEIHQQLDIHLKMATERPTSCNSSSKFSATH